MAIDQAWGLSAGTALPRALEDFIRTSYEDVLEAPVVPDRSVEESAARVAAVDFSKPVGLDEAIREAAALMRDGDLLSSSARCFGYFNPTSALPAVVADVMTAARNPQMAVVTHAPASVAMERRVVRYFLDRLEFPASATGNFTSGGSEANASAVLLALVRAHDDFAKRGVRAFDRQPYLYASADCHLAWVKIARASGLGSDALRLVPTSGDGRMDADALERMLRTDAEHSTPVMIAATAGTTNAGEIDPLARCREIADAYGAHLHVDAAWAGALVLDERRKALLRGIEAADSVTIDAHKWLSVPMGAGMFFARDREALGRAYSVATGYMPSGDGEDAYITTSQWSRRFLGLRMWMMLRATGAEAYEMLFDRHFEATRWLRDELRERGWRVRNRGELPVLVFDDARYGVPSQAIADGLAADGRVWLGCVDFEGRSLLRACPTSFMTKQEDLQALVDRLDFVRERSNRSATK